MEPLTVLLILAVINGVCGEHSAEDISNNTLSSSPSSNENISSTSGDLYSDQVTENSTNNSSNLATSTPSNEAIITSTTANQITESTTNIDSSSLDVIETDLTSDFETSSTEHDLTSTKNTFPINFVKENEFGNELLSEFATSTDESDSSGDGNPDTTVYVVGHVSKLITNEFDLDNFTKTNASESPISLTHNLPIIDDELLLNETDNDSMDLTTNSTSDEVIVNIQHVEFTSSNNISNLRNTSDYSRVLEEPASIVFGLSTPISNLNEKGDKNVPVEESSSSTLDYFKFKTKDTKPELENTTVVTTADKILSIEDDTTTSPETSSVEDVPKKTEIGANSDPLISEQSGVWFHNLTTNHETESVETSEFDIDATASEEKRTGKMVPFPSMTSQTETTPEVSYANGNVPELKESSSDIIDQTVEVSPVKFDSTDGVTPPVLIDSIYDPIKHHEDLKDNEYTNAVTVIFTVPQPVQMDVFWDEERNRKFRNFVINAINLEEDKGWPNLALEEDVIYEKYDTEWVRRRRETKLGLQPEDLIYIAPSPMAENRNIYVAFFIRNGSTPDPDDVVYGTKIFYAINSTRIGLEQEMALNITRITPGIILVRYMDSIFIRYAIVFIALLAVAVFCICVIIFGLIYIKCKSSRGKWDRSEYGDKNKLKMDLRLSRDMGTDHDIQNDESQTGKNGQPYKSGIEKLDIRILRDDDGWVKPLDDSVIAVPQQRQRTEDTKL